MTPSYRCPMELSGKSSRRPHGDGSEPVPEQAALAPRDVSFSIISSDGIVSDLQVSWAEEERN